MSTNKKAKSWNFWFIKHWHEEKKKLVLNLAFFKNQPKVCLRACYRLASARLAHAALRFARAPTGAHYTVPAAAFESLWARTHPLPHVNLLQLWIGNPKCYTYIPKKAECSVLTSFLFCFCTEELVFDFKSKIKEEVSLNHCAWPWFFWKSYFNKY